MKTNYKRGAYNEINLISLSKTMSKQDTNLFNEIENIVREYYKSTVRAGTDEENCSLCKFYNVNFSSQDRDPIVLSHEGEIYRECGAAGYLIIDTLVCNQFQVKQFKN